MDALVRAGKGGDNIRWVIYNKEIDIIALLELLFDMVPKQMEENLANGASG